MSDDSKRDEWVCVTGATGFVAGHVIRTLLERGYRVRGTVRDLTKHASVAHLHEHAAQLGAQLELVAADLTVPGSFTDAVAGCAHVCHIASSVRLTAPDPQRDIVDVALAGTRNVFNAILAAGCARRVVMTSSIAAVVEESKPLEHLHDEHDWNDHATLESSPYQLSKVLAERAAWAMLEQHPGPAPFRLVCLHPGLILGPVLNPAHARASPSIIVELLGGKLPRVPNFSFATVDVRDVAKAHVRALELPEAQGRYILSADEVHFIDFANWLRAAYPDRKLPRKRMPDLAMYLFALFDSRLSWTFLRENLSLLRRVDNRRSRTELGLDYTPLEQTVLDTARSLIELAVDTNTARP